MLAALTSHRAGLLSVSDNGVGMTKQELNSWAVMNLSMEDRGLKPQEAEDGPGLGRFLSGNLSYFGVGRVLTSVLPSIHLSPVVFKVEVDSLNVEILLAWHLVQMCSTLGSLTSTYHMLQGP